MSWCYPATIEPKSPCDSSCGPAELVRRQREAPRSVERPTRRDARDQVPGRVVLVDVAEVRSGDLVFLQLVLLGIRDEHLRADHLDPERREAGRQAGVRELSG